MEEEQSMAEEINKIEEGRFESIMKSISDFNMQNRTFDMSIRRQYQNGSKDVDVSAPTMKEAKDLLDYCLGKLE